MEVSKHNTANVLSSDFSLLSNLKKFHSSLGTKSEDPEIETQPCKSWPSRLCNCILLQPEEQRNHYNFGHHDTYCWVISSWLCLCLSCQVNVNRQTDSSRCMVNEFETCAHSSTTFHAKSGMENGKHCLMAKGWWRDVILCTAVCEISSSEKKCNPTHATWHVSEGCGLWSWDFVDCSWPVGPLVCSCIMEG